jgi:hypothetical protein
MDKDLIHQIIDARLKELGLLSEAKDVPAPTILNDLIINGNIFMQGMLYSAGGSYTTTNMPSGFTTNTIYR